MHSGNLEKVRNAMLQILAEDQEEMRTQAMQLKTTTEVPQIALWV